MKYVFWLLLAAGLIWAWQNPDKVRNASDVASKWIGEKSRIVADKWDPISKESSSSEEEVSLRDLPEGVFVLRQEVVVSAKNQIVKWPAGMSVRKLGEGAGKALVSDGTNQTTVDVSLLTRDTQERKVLYKNTRTSAAGQAKVAAQGLERELAEVESKLFALQNEKRQLLALQKEHGERPMTTTTEFLDLAIRRQEDRRQEIHKLLGRSAPQFLIK